MTRLIEQTLYHLDPHTPRRLASRTVPPSQVSTRTVATVHPPKDHLMKFLEIDFHTVSIEFQSIGFEWPRVWNREEGLYSDSALKALSFNSGSILR